MHIFDTSKLATCSHAVRRVLSIYKATHRPLHFTATILHAAHVARNLQPALNTSPELRIDGLTELLTWNVCYLAEIPVYFHFPIFCVSLFPPRLFMYCIFIFIRIFFWFLSILLLCLS